MSGARVAVLASGRGSNLQALLDDPVVRPWIALVVSDREDSGALLRAEDAGVFLPETGAADLLARAGARPLTALHGCFYLSLSRLPTPGRLV